MPSVRAFPTATSITSPSPHTKWSSLAHQKTLPHHSANAWQLMVQDQEGTLDLFFLSVTQVYSQLCVVPCSQSIDKKTRDKAVKALGKWISNKTEFTHLELMKLWKGLFYCTFHDTVDRFFLQRLDQSLAWTTLPNSPSSLSFHCWLRTFLGVWMSDKPIIQQQLSETLSSLILRVPRSSVMDFIATFWQTMCGEWHGIDRLRYEERMRETSFFNSSGKDDYKWRRINR